MKFYSGTYGKDTLQSNALVTGLLKYPEISSKMIQQYPQYCLSYFVDGTSRFAKEEIVGDVSVKWAIQGRLNRPATLTGVSTALPAGAAGSIFTVEFEENFFNPNDVVRFKGGVQAVVLSEPQPTAGGYTYRMKLMTNDATATITAVSISAGLTANTVASAFPEGSDRGYENSVYPDWYTNYLGITRKSKSVTGSALTSSVGTISEVNGDANTGTLAGQFLTPSVGQVDGVSVAEATGSQANISVGQVTNTGTANVSVTGIGLTSSVGTPIIYSWNEIDPNVNNVWTEVDLAA